jgi:hypothetical protein
MSHTSYRGDPYWLTARYTGRCGQCERPIKRGDRAWYYPKGRYIYCEPCGQPLAARFHAEAADEDMMSGRW